MKEQTQQPSREAMQSLEALRSAVREALDRKRRLGQHAVVWRNDHLEVPGWLDSHDTLGQ